MIKENKDYKKAVYAWIMQNTEPKSHGHTREELMLGVELDYDSRLDYGLISTIEKSWRDTIDIDYDNLRRHKQITDDFTKAWSPFLSEENRMGRFYFISGVIIDHDGNETLGQYQPTAQEKIAYDDNRTEALTAQLKSHTIRMEQKNEITAIQRRAKRAIEDMEQSKLI